MTGNKPIKAVKLQKNLLVVVLEDQVIVYDHDIKERGRDHTTENPNGLVAISPDTEHIVLAYVSTEIGLNLHLLYSLKCLSLNVSQFYHKTALCTNWNGGGESFKFISRTKGAYFST